MKVLRVDLMGEADHTEANEAAGIDGPDEGAIGRAAVPGEAAPGPPSENFPRPLSSRTASEAGHTETDKVESDVGLVVDSAGRVAITGDVEQRAAPDNFPRPQPPSIQALPSVGAPS